MLSSEEKKKEMLKKGLNDDRKRDLLKYETQLEDLTRAKANILKQKAKERKIKDASASLDFLNNLPVTQSKAQLLANTLLEQSAEIVPQKAQAQAPVPDVVIVKGETVKIPKTLTQIDALKIKVEKEQEKQEKEQIQLEKQHIQLEKAVEVIQRKVYNITRKKPEATAQIEKLEEKIDKTQEQQNTVSQKIDDIQEQIDENTNTLNILEQQQKKKPGRPKKAQAQEQAQAQAQEQAQEEQQKKKPGRPKKETPVYNEPEIETSGLTYKQQQQNTAIDIKKMIEEAKKKKTKGGNFWGDLSRKYGGSDEAWGSGFKKQYQVGYNEDYSPAEYIYD
jgi:hypothetical protein